MEVTHIPITKHAPAYIVAACTAEKERLHAVDRLAHAGASQLLRRAGASPVVRSPSRELSYTSQLREAIESANATNDPELQESIRLSLGSAQHSALF